MAIIKTPNGNIHYVSIPLYEGVKQIDKEIADENLILLKKLFDSLNIKFQLAYGTLLGAVREKDFISHDEDIDLALLDEEREKLLSNIQILRNHGFEICRYDRRDLISLIRKGEYIDLYFFRRYKDGMRMCSGEVMLEDFLKDSVEYEFKGNLYLIPRRYLDFLSCYYGENWKIPIQTNNYQMGFWKVKAFELKDKLKNLLPDWLFLRLASISQNKRREHTEAKMLKAIERQGNITSSSK